MRKKNMENLIGDIFESMKIFMKNNGSYSTQDIETYFDQLNTVLKSERISIWKLYLDENKILIGCNQYRNKEIKVMFYNEWLEDTIHDDDRNKFTEWIHDILNDKTSYNITISFRHLDNFEYFSFSGYLFYEDGKKVIMGTSKNVNNKVKMYRKANLLLKIFEYYPKPMAVFNNSRLIEYINPSFENLFEVKSQDLLNKSVLSLINIIKFDYDFEVLVKQLSAGNTVSGNAYTKNPSGISISLEYYLSPIFIENKLTKVIGFFYDKTTENNMQLLKSQKVKRDAIGKLAGGIAHDFNNILQVVQGFAEDALEEVGTETIVGEDLVEVLKASHKAKSLIAQLLEFSRNRSLENAKPLNLKKSLIDLFEYIQFHNKRNIIIELAEMEECFAIVPIDELDSVVSNIVTNSKQAITSQGGKITISLKKVSYNSLDKGTKLKLKDTDYAELIISDNGSGMSDEISYKIFDPYFTTKRVGEGVGFGLSVAWGIVVRYKGCIIVDTKLGVGTSMKIYLPLASEEKILLNPEENL